MEKKKKKKKKNELKEEVLQMLHSHYPSLIMIWQCWASNQYIGMYGINLLSGCLKI